MTFDQLQARLGRTLDPADWSQTKDGGWVEKTAKVAPSARVADDAVVYGRALVSGNAWVYGSAEVFGNAWVYGRARVYGNSMVFGTARIHGNARVSGHAWIREGELDFGEWVYGDDWAQFQARQNLKAELEADLEESARRLVR